MPTPNTMTTHLQQNNKQAKTEHASLIDQLLHKTVQHNCHIADASHAGDYTLCIYLLKMRELYRWENKANFSKELSNKSVGTWLREREELWASLELEEFKNITIGSAEFRPFDSNEINNTLKASNLVYSGGLGINNRPHFFLADLEHHETHSEYELYIAGKEYARDMAAPPAMSVNNTIFIRKESFRRLLWEKLETWRWNRPDNALGRAFACYDCEHDLENALAEMSECEVGNVIQHELGEIKAGQLLGEEWEKLLFSLPHSKASLMLRAVRDHLADSLTTLPRLLKLNHTASWHFYFGNLNNMRKLLFPSLDKAYQHWLETQSLSELTAIIERSQPHWLALCEAILQIEANDLKSKQLAIQDLIENQYL